MRIKHPARVLHEFVRGRARENPRRVDSPPPFLLASPRTMRRTHRHVACSVLLHDGVLPTGPGRHHPAARRRRRARREVEQRHVDALRRRHLDDPRVIGRAAARRRRHGAREEAVRPRHLDRVRRLALLLIR